MSGSNFNFSENTFNLSEGFCHVLPEYLVVTSDRDFNKVLRHKEHNSYTRYSSLIMFLAVILALTAVNSFVNDHAIEGIFFALLTAGCLYFYFRWRGKSNTPVIHKKRIRNIQLKRIQSNPVFVVLFQDTTGKFKMRHLPMKAEDLQQIDKALKILRSHNLMSAQSINQQSSYQPDFAHELKKTNQNLSQGYSTPPKQEKSKRDTSYKRNKDGYLKDY